MSSINTSSGVVALRPYWSVTTVPSFSTWTAWIPLYQTSPPPDGCAQIMSSMHWSVGVEGFASMMLLIFCARIIYSSQDEKLLTSVRLSERVALWTEYSGPVDVQSVKLDFLKKIHRVAPPFRCKVEVKATRVAFKVSQKR